MKPTTKKPKLCGAKINSVVHYWADSWGGCVRYGHGDEFGVVRCAKPLGHTGGHAIIKPITRKIKVTLDYCGWD